MSKETHRHAAGTSGAIEIYERPIRDPFAGEGAETIVALDGWIKLHARAWSDLAVQDDTWTAPLRGKRLAKRGPGWRKLEGEERENALAWAVDLLTED